LATEINCVYLGQLRCQSSHQASGEKVITDAPLDNCGKGESFSPTDLVGTALGSCMLTIIGIVGERHEMDLADVKVQVFKHMSSGSVRKISRLEVKLTGPLGASPKDRKRIEAAALSCPVHKTLEDSLDIEVEFLWPK